MRRKCYAEVDVFADGHLVISKNSETIEYTLNPISIFTIFQYPEFSQLLSEFIRIPDVKSNFSLLPDGFKVSLPNKKVYEKFIEQIKKYGAKNES